MCWRRLRRAFLKLCIFKVFFRFKVNIVMKGSALSDLFDQIRLKFLWRSHNLIISLNIRLRMIQILRIRYQISLHKRRLLLLLLMILLLWGLEIVLLHRFFKSFALSNMFRGWSFIARIWIEVRLNIFRWRCNKLFHLFETNWTIRRSEFQSRLHLKTGNMGQMERIAWHLNDFFIETELFNTHGTYGVVSNFSVSSPGA